MKATPTDKAGDRPAGESRPRPRPSRAHQIGADLDDHLQDGAGADRQRQRRPLRRVGEAADPQADDRRAARQQRQAGEGPERRPLLQDRRGDADAFGDVVQREAQHQERAEPRRARREGRADRQPFAEIVQADAERDEGRERKPGRRAVRGGRPPSAEGSWPPPRARPSTGPWNIAADFAGKFERFLERIDQKERQQADGQRQQEVHAVRGRRRAAPDKTSGRSRPARCRRRCRAAPAAQARRVACRRRHRDRDLVLERRAGVGDDVDGVRLAQHPGERQRDPGGRAARDRRRPAPA